MSDTQENTPNTETAPADSTTRELIYRQLRPQVEQGISDGIEDEKNRLRYGSGFWGSILGFLFQLAEALGIDKWVAGLFGKHIPDETDKKILTDQVTASVSDVLTEKDAAGKPKLAGMSNEQVKEAVRERVAQDLQSNEAIARHFTEEQIARIASETAAGVKDKADMIRAVVAPPPGRLNVTDVTLTGTPQQQVEQTLGAVADSILTGPMIKEEKKRAEAMELKPALVSIGTKVVMENEDKINDPDALAGLYIDALQKDEKIRNKLAGLELDLNNPDSREMFTIVMKNHLGEDTAKTLTKAVKGQATAIAVQAPAMPSEKEIKSMISRKAAATVAEGIKSATAVGAMASYHDSWVTTIDGDDITIMHKYYYHDPSKNDGKKAEHYWRNDVPDQNGELRRTENKLYHQAVSWHKALNDEQRLEAGNIVGKAVSETLSDFNDRKLGDTPEDRQALKAALQKNIKAALYENKDRLNALGPDNTVETINYKLTDDKTHPFDLLAKMSESIATSVAENKGGSYNELTKAQNILFDSKPPAVARGDMPEIPEGVVAQNIRGGRHKDIPAGTNVQPLGGGGPGSDIHLG